MGMFMNYMKMIESETYKFRITEFAQNFKMRIRIYSQF